MSKGSRDWMQFPFRWYDTLLGLPDSTMRKYLEAMRDYGRDGVEPSFSDPLQAALWKEFAGVIDFYREKYEAICDRNRENGKDGGRPPKKPNEPKKPSGFTENPVGANQDTRKDTRKEEEKKEKEEIETDTHTPYPKTDTEVCVLADRKGIDCPQKVAELYLASRQARAWKDRNGTPIVDVGADLKAFVLSYEANHQHADDREVQKRCGILTEPPKFKPNGRGAKSQGAGEGKWRV